MNITLEPYARLITIYLDQHMEFVTGQAYNLGYG